MKIFEKSIKKFRKIAPGNSKLHLWKGSSSQYWEDRYKNKGNSGSGSYGILSKYKANFVNNFLKNNNIKSVIEFGCGDGNQLSLINYPIYYGIDVSQKSIEFCKQIFLDDKSKNFFQLSETPDLVCDLSISMDVIFHLVEDEIYENHIQNLFSHSSKFVLIYSSNENKKQLFFQPHIKHRNFSDWILKKYNNWSLLSYYENPYKKFIDGSFSDFYIYKKSDN